MARVVVKPKGSVSHDISLSDGKVVLGFSLKGGPRGIQEIPGTPSTLHLTPGGTKFGDWDPFYSHIQTRTAIGGRASDDFSEDPTRFYDSKNLFTMIDRKIFPAPQWKFATGLRTTHENLPGDMEWQALIGNERYVSRAFTVGGSNLSADNAQIWIRRKGTPGTLTIEIWTDTAGDPNAIVASATGTITVTDVPDFVSRFVTVDLSAASDLTQSTTYHIVIYAVTGDSAASHWEIGVDGTTGTSKDSSDGSSWASATFDIYYRVSDADIDRKWHFFEIDQAIYAVDERADAANSVVYMNGERGKATSGGNTTLVDTDDGIDGTWTDDQWNGWRIKIVGGTGKGQFRLISDTTSGGTITVAVAWANNPDSTSEYVIYGGAAWQSVGSATLTTVFDVAVIDNLAYFAQGSGDNIRTMRFNASASPPAHEFRDDSTNKADRLLTAYITGTGPVMWRAENDSVDVSRADAVSWSSNLSFGDAIEVGDTTFPITNFLVYDNVLYVWKENGLWAIVNDEALNPLGGLGFIRTSNNGEAVVEHGSFIYFSWGDFALMQLVGKELISIGPDKGTGLPSGRGGKIAALGSHPAGLFAAIDGGTANTSSLMVYAVKGFGWHEIFRAWGTGNRVQNFFWQDNSGTRPRLWISVNGDMVYQEWPGNTFNPLEDSGLNFQHEGVFDMSDIDFGAAELPKLFKELNLFSKNLAAGIEVFMDYQLDADIGSTTFWNQGLVFGQSPHAILPIGRGNVKKIRIRLRLNTKTASTPPIIEAIVLEGFARTPLKYQWNIKLRIADDQRTKKGGLDFDPDVLLDWLKEKAANTDLIHMRSIFRNMDDRYVIVEPPSLMRKFANTLGGKWGGEVTITLREA